ncbi:MAG: hypothetical protein JXR22_12140 [Prolixibacteraceae bacterium]|nr:hypothetical protein [Prolixibacteraceae bacterium]
MEKLLNDHLMDYKFFGNMNQPSDVMTCSEMSTELYESEIEKGNLQDYLEIYGELDN